MNSYVTEASVREEASTFKPTVATFTINPPNTTLQINRTINLLTSLNDQDVFKYIAEFNEIASLSRWNEETSNEVLTSLTASNLLGYYTNCHSTKDKFQSLLKHKYPQTDSLKYYNQISSIKQKDFYTISCYKAKIYDICKQLAACNSWNSETLQFKIEEVFYNGLSKRSQLEMARLNVHSIK
jgi:hypothetical protein